MPKKSMIPKSRKITIGRAWGRFFIKTPCMETLCPTLDDMLNRLLFMFEGRTRTLDGDRYGKVIIERGGYAAASSSCEHLCLRCAHWNGNNPCAKDKTEAGFYVYHVHRRVQACDQFREPLQDAGRDGLYLVNQDGQKLRM